MTQVVSFIGYTPPARYDAVPWTDVQIQEAPTNTGAWTVIDTVTFGSTDPDPSTPAARSFTTALGTAPDLWYRVLFLDGSSGVSEPTAAVQNGGISNLYVTVSELKTLLGLSNETFDDAAIAIAAQAASRACDGYKSTRFYSASETRYYTAEYGARSITVDDLSAITSVTVDMNGDGTYEATWVEGTDFYLDPPNASLDGRPGRELTIRRQTGRYFPIWDRAVKIQGTFGWTTTPPQVKQAAVLIANRLLTRTGQAPLGVLVAAAGDAVTTARLGRIDSDAAFLLDQIPGARYPAVVALKLG